MRDKVIQRWEDISKEVCSRRPRHRRGLAQALGPEPTQEEPAVVHADAGSLVLPACFWYGEWCDNHSATVTAWGQAGGRGSLEGAGSHARVSWLRLGSAESPLDS